MRCIVHRVLQLFANSHSPAASHRLCQVGSPLGQTYLPLRPQVAFEEASSSSLGWPRDDERTEAEPTTLWTGYRLTDTPWPRGAAQHLSRTLGVQTLTFSTACDAAAQVQSLSTQRLRSTSGRPLQWWDGSAKAVRLHLSPYGRPSFIMAAVGRMAASAAAVRGSSGCTCPRFFSDKFHLQQLDHPHQREAILPGVGRCAAAAGARTQCPSLSATPPPCADRCPLLP